MTMAPIDYTPPSSAQLVKATAAAAVVAAMVLVFAVLPAEYGIDPTGIGRVLGLTAMGTQKSQASTARTTIASDGARKDQLELTLPPKKGAELTFEWSTGGPALYFDFHGEAYDAPKDVFTSYETGTKREASGSFRPPFDGRHGWYWRNDTNETVTVRLRTSGGYDDIQTM